MEPAKLTCQGKPGEDCAARWIDTKYGQGRYLCTGQTPGARMKPRPHPVEDTFQSPNDAFAPLLKAQKQLFQGREDIVNPPRVVVSPPPAKTSDGGSTDYYKIPDGAADLQDLIEAKNMNFATGNIFKACYRLGEKVGTSGAYDLRKIIFFAERELKRIAKGP